MKLSSIKKEALRLDFVILKETENSLFAMGHGHDLEVQGGVLTIRPQSRRHEYDHGSDYNPGGYIFPRRLKDISYHLFGYHN